MTRWVLITALLLPVLSALPATAQVPPLIAISTTDSVTVKLTQPVAGYLRYEIRHWPDGALLTSGSAPVVKDDSGMSVFRVSGLSPKLWWPQDPQLYTIAVTDSAGKEIGSARFGFRSFEIKDRKFTFNGRPLFLRGLPINPPGRELPEETGKDPAFIRDYLRLLKSANVNLIRTDTQPWLDACDEIGLLVFTGKYGPPPGGHVDSPPPVESAVPFYRDMVANLASHPSVVIYVLTNEVDQKACGQFLDAIRESIRLVDPTRPVIGNAGFGRGGSGEIYDIHPYDGWYNGNPMDWYRFPEWIAAADKLGKPLTLSECVGAYTVDAGIFSTQSKQMPTMLRWVGPVEDQRGAALAYQAELVKNLVEIGRIMRTETSGVAGLMPFTYFFSWHDAKSGKDVIPKPCFDTLKAAYQPVMIAAECWKRNLYAGDSLEVQLHVANDDDSGHALGVSRGVVEVLDAKRAVIASAGTDFGSIPYYSNSSAKVTVRLPASLPKGDYRVRPKLLDLNRVVFGNPFEITVRPRGWAKSTAKLALYDPSGQTATALKKLGAEVTAVSDLTKLPSSGLLVIGEEALTKDTYPTKAEMLAFLNRGGRVLCLLQDRAGWSSDWLPAEFIPTFGASPYTYIHPVGGNESIFKELRDRDFHYWNELGRDAAGKPAVHPAAWLLRPNGVEDLSSTRIWASSGRLIAGVALVEFTHGKGRVVVNQFRCVERVGTDPIADRLLSNLVNYAASASLAQPVNLSKPVRWGLPAIRSGVFANQAQGFLPHSPVFHYEGSSKGLQAAEQGVDGVTLVGSYQFNSRGWLEPVPDMAQDGWGVVYGSLSQPASVFSLKLYNMATEPKSIRLLLDGKQIGEAQSVPAGAEATLTWQIQRKPGLVKLELRGSQYLVLKESQFSLPY